MAKFEYDEEQDYFLIDPKFLSKGLEMAKQKKYKSIRITPLDFREDKLEFNIDELARCKWIRRLILDEELPIPPNDGKAIEHLINLEELNIKEFAQLDFSVFPKLKELVLVNGTSLQGLEKVDSLKLLYLALWKGDSLPKNIGHISATEVRISAGRKLKNIESLFGLAGLKKLMLQDLPALAVSKNINKLKSLTELHVEQCGWTDFSDLRIAALEDIFVSKVASLHFIAKLKSLRKLYIWDSVDGDMLPVMKHPMLKEIYFSVQKKHYSHKEKFLQEHLKIKALRKA